MTVFAGREGRWKYETCPPESPRPKRAEAGFGANVLEVVERCLVDCKVRDIHVS